jgi:hypothetical protein
MDLQSNGSSISKGHIDTFDLKYNIVKVIEKNDNKNEINTLENEPVMKQVSFEEFAKDFKI